MFRIAEDKYIEEIKKDSYLEAIQVLYKFHLQPFFESFDSQKWREERYFKEECELVFKTYSLIF